MTTQNSAFDRAHRVLLGTLIIVFGTLTQANPSWFY